VAMKKESAVVFFLVLTFFLTGVIAVDVTQNLTATIVDDIDIYINEFESNTPGNPDEEWVELYNDENFEVNIGGWEIYDGLASETLRHTVPLDTFIAGKGFYVADVSGLNNSGEFIILKGPNGTIFDETPELADGDDDDNTWSRFPDGVGNFTFQGSTKGFTNVPTVIQNKSIDSECVLENDNVTLTAKVFGICIEEVVFSVFLEDDWVNFTGVNTFDENYETEIFGGIFFNGGEEVNWTVYAINCFNDTKKNGMESFRVNSATHLTVLPGVLEGENGWYLFEPQFSLTNPDGNISYRWNGDADQNYMGPFGLEDAPNDANIKGGKHTLKYHADICEEEEKEFHGMFDFTNPEIIDLQPANGSTVFDSLVEISAYLEEFYQANSGINEGETFMEVDGSLVNANISDADTIDSIISYSAEFADGEHEVFVHVKDNAGRVSELSWSFFVEVTEFNLVVNSPEEKAYNNRRVPFNLTTSLESELIEFINWNDRNPRFRRLCRDCDSYGFDRKRTQTMNEGENNLTIRAHGSLIEKNISLFVDSKKPKITKTEPKGGFASGIFSIEFDEENPVSLFLNYGNGSEVRNSEVDLQDCFSEKCIVSVNLSDFEGQEIEFWFNLTDIAESFVESRVVDVEVDTLAPSVNSFESEFDGKKVEFIFNVSEENFDKISYIDSFDSRAREKNICTRLDNGICDKTSSFRDGEHQLNFTIADKSGNTAIENVSFLIDSKKPKITKTEPRRGFSNGLFMVEFDEENPVSLFLNYGNESETRNVVGDLGACFENRGKTKCNVPVNLSDFEGQEIEFWFNLTDIVGNFVESRKNGVEVDTLAPVVNFFNSSINGRRVEFFINVSEENFDEISYIDSFDSTPRLRKICNRLNDEICDKTISFRTGEHFLNISALDKAGNSAVVFDDLNFTIF